MRVLIIDDDAELCRLLGEFLSREGFEVVSVPNGERGLQEVAGGRVDLVVLDVMLPGVDGFSVLRRLRELSRVPVLMLTARGEDIDRILGLELGADDYLPKPFNPRELAARIRAIGRRVAMRAEQGGERYLVNGVRLDAGAREVEVEGRKVDLTTTEFEILRALMRAAGRVLTRDELMEQVYGRKAGPYDRAIDVHIGHLRRKIDTDRPRIRTVRGVGYQFARDPEEGER